MNINIGGTIGWKNVHEDVRKRWTVLDAAPKSPIQYDLNSRRNFPIDDNSVDNYYASHVLEHVDTFLLPFVFSEIHRTLKPFGRVRIVVPDIRVGIERYRNGHELRCSPYCTPDIALPRLHLEL